MDKLIPIGGYGVIIVLIIMLFLIVSCTKIGKGNRTLIKSLVDNNDSIKNIYPHLIVTTGKERAVHLTKSGKSYQDFRKFLKKRYNNEDYKAAELSVTVRNRNANPAFNPIDISRLSSKLIEFYTNTDKQSNEEKIKTEELLTARLQNKPDLLPTTTFHHYDDDNRKVFYTYPRVSLDFSVRLLTPGVIDRLSYLGIVLKLKPTDSTNDNSIRFLDFSPKGADIIEYTRGNFTQTTEAAAKANQGIAEGEKGSISINEAPYTRAREHSSAINFGSELSVSLSETYVNELKDAIEKQTSGILDNGKIFFSEFKSIKNKRIGGTYNFDLMLEIPALVKGPSNTSPLYYYSKPAADKVKVEAFLVGIVRHVYQRGMTGNFTTVPEPENDDVYEQVVVNTVNNLLLWESSNFTWVGKEPIVTEKYEIYVITNIDNARFVVKSESGTVLGTGLGPEATIMITPKKDQDVKAYVEFFPVINTNPEGNIIEFFAPQSPAFIIEKDKGGKQTITGIYTMSSN